MSSENREDYLISILRLSEGGEAVRTSKLAAFMNVAPASVTEMLRVLADLGYVNYVKYQGVSLTPEGLAYAKNIRRKHHVIERFLIDMLDIPHEEAHEQACLMEHSTSDESINRICRMIGTKVDHDCSTCDNPCGGESTVNYTAYQMSEGESGIISHLKSNNRDELKMLISMGLRPGCRITVDEVDGDVRYIGLNGDSVAVESRLTSSIFIRKE